MWKETRTRKLSIGPMLSWTLASLYRSRDIGCSTTLKISSMMTSSQVQESMGCLKLRSITYPVKASINTFKRSSTWLCWRTMMNSSLGWDRGREENKHLNEVVRVYSSERTKEHRVKLTKWSNRIPLIHSDRFQINLGSKTFRSMNQNLILSQMLTHNFNRCQPMIPILTLITHRTGSSPFLRMTT